MRMLRFSRFDVARADMGRVGLADDGRRDRVDADGRGAASLRGAAAVRSVDLLKLRVVDLDTEGFIDSSEVGLESFSRQLDAMGQPLREVVQEKGSPRVYRVARRGSSGRASCRRQI